MTAYASLDDLKRYTDIPTGNTIDDDLLTMALDSASAIIDTQTHRTFAAAADTTRLHDAFKDVQGLSLWLNGDLAQLTSVTDGDGAAIPLTSIITEPIDQPPFFLLTLKRSKGLSWSYTDDPEGAIAVEGRWAYSIEPPAQIVQATVRLAAWLYRQRDNSLDLDRTVIVASSVLTPAALPADVLFILRPFMRVIP